MDRFPAALNAVCPYYTMFPLDFPLGVLTRRSRPKQWVLDPFCGRGTTAFAARLLGLPSIGLDSNPLAAALAAAKLPSVSPRQIIVTARYILKALTPLYVKTLVQAAWMISWRARKSVMTRW